MSPGAKLPPYETPALGSVSRIQVERLPERCEDDGWIIRNPWGSVWHPDLFKEPQDAMAYLLKVWADHSEAQLIAQGWTIVRGRRVISAINTGELMQVDSWVPEGTM